MLEKSGHAYKELSIYIFTKSKAKSQSRVKLFPQEC